MYTDLNCTSSYEARVFPFVFPTHRTQVATNVRMKITPKAPTTRPIGIATPRIAPEVDALSSLVLPACPGGPFCPLLVANTEGFTVTLPVSVAVPVPVSGAVPVAVVVANEAVSFAAGLELVSAS